MNNLYVLVNSPGELSGWLAPVAREISELKNIEITVVTLPCPYASGQEANSALSLPAVVRSIKISDVRRGSAHNVVLQLGGDPMYGFFISRKLKCPWLIYTARPRWKRFVSHYFVPDEFARARFEAAGVSNFTFCGNLMADSVPEFIDAEKFRCEFAQGKKIISFMCGSRPFEYTRAAPFFAESAAILASKFPDWQSVFPLAPTVDRHAIEAGLKAAGMAVSQNIICVSASCTIPMVYGRSYEALKASSLVMAFPGTNNLQTALIGTPLIVTAPYNFAEEIPLDGLAGLLPHNSRIMKHIKRSFVVAYAKKHPLLSLPNKLAGKMIVPELLGLATAKSIAHYAEIYMADKNKREQIAHNMKELNVPRGAARKIAHTAATYFQ